MKNFFVLLCTLLVNIVQGQTTLPLVTTDSLISEAIKIMDRGNYQESMDKLAQVSTLSPKYSNAQYYYAYGAYQKKEFKTALEILDGISKYANIRKEFKYHQVKAAICAELQETQKVQEAYFKLQESFPYKAIGYYDYAIFLVKNKRFDEAVTALQKSLYLNPFHYESHFMLGALAVENGYYSEGIISTITALYLYPESKSNNSALLNLNKYLVTESKEKVALNLHNDAKNPFLQGEKYLKSGFGMSKDYDNETEFDDKFMNQIHLFWYSLDKTKDTGSFYNEFYIPFWKKVKDDLSFNTLACILYYNLDNKNTQRLVKKESKNIGQTYMNFDQKYRDLLCYRSKDLKGNTKRVYYNVENGELTGVGPYDGEKIHGTWDYIMPKDGLHLTTITYDQSGKAQGAAKFYNLNGLFKTVTFKNNEIDGWEIFYDKNGKEESRLFYKNGNVEGEAIQKYPDGSVMCTKNFNKNELQGNYQCNYPDGTKEIELNFTKGNADGIKKYYNRIGNLTEEVQLMDNKINGYSRGFYDDGTISYVENYKNDVLVGEQKYYFPDGKIKVIDNYRKDGTIKSSTNYNMLGNVIKSGTFNSKGEIDGELNDYFYNGDRKSVSIYKNGGLKKYQPFDFKGDIIQEIKISNKKVYTYLNIWGDPMSKGKKIKNKLQGKWTYFYPNGEVSQVTNYNSNANIEGETIDYYPNGKVQSKSNYVDGKLEGLYQNFFRNGNLRIEGVYNSDHPIGEWRFYDPDKTMHKVVFYNDNGKVIKEQQLHKDGEPHITYYYEGDRVVKIQTYGKEGEIHDFVEMSGNQTVIIKSNGVRFDAEINNGLKHGRENVYDAANQPIFERSFKNGVIDGEQISYNVLGNRSSTINYIAGKEWGISKTFDYFGNLISKSTMKDGSYFGNVAVFYPNGNKRYDWTGQNNDCVSPISYYGSNGVLLFTKYEDNDYFYGYKLSGQEFKIAPKGKANIVAYYENGNKGLEIDYENGKINGKYNFYYENGQPYIVSTKLNSSNEGERTIYFPNGKLSYKENYVDGQRHGAVEIFNENGDKVADLNYNYGSLHGENRIYENKKLKYTKIYDLGNMLEVKVH